MKWTVAKIKANIAAFVKGQELVKSPKFRGAPFGRLNPTIPSKKVRYLKEVRS